MQDDNKSTQSIEDLIASSRGEFKSDESAQTKFSEKQEEIKLKEIERLTMQKAARSGIPYINLSGFAVSPEALSLIKEEDGKRLSVVCFFYDGQNIR